ncbi:MAG: hypothetical protein AB8G22_11805 [Saprospiraceae bacterium]
MIRSISPSLHQFEDRLAAVTIGLILILFSCPTILCAQNSWNVQLNRNFLDCDARQVCYQLEVQSNSSDWTLGDQNYRLFFDGDLMTVTSVTSLLPSSYYSTAQIDQNVKISGQGQESASPLDDIDDNLGFLDFNIIQTDKTAPASAALLTTNTFTPVATICLDVAESVITNSGDDCLSFYYSRPSTAGSITNQYTVISENDSPDNTSATVGDGYDDLTSADGNAACLTDCSVDARWDIQLSRNFLDCDARQVCYQLEVQSNSSNWTLGDQNYRLFFDGDLMTVTSVTSLLPSSYYSSAQIDQNVKISGQGQESASPLNDIDNNLGFLDFSIIQTDKTTPSAATQLVTNTFTPVATICLDVAESVITSNGSECLSFYHSRSATAGSITNQYTVISENNSPNQTTEAIGINYDDLTNADGSAACVGGDCDTPQGEICDNGRDDDGDGLVDGDDPDCCNFNLEFICDNNGTSGNPTDDTFTIIVTNTNTNSPDETYNITGDVILSDIPYQESTNIDQSFSMYGDSLVFDISDASNASCERNTVYLEAPDHCSNCNISIENVETTDCIAGQYDLRVTVAYRDLPTEELEINGQRFSVAQASTERSQTAMEVFTLSGMTCDINQELVITVSVPDDNSCQATTTYQAPGTCSITLESISVSDCILDNYSIDITFQLENSTGLIDINGCTFAPSTSNGVENFTLLNQDCHLQATQQIRLQFVDNPACTITTDITPPCPKPKFCVLGSE